MTNKSTNIENGLYLICNRDAKIKEVLFDDLKLISSDTLPSEFSEILDQKSLSKAADFWKDILEHEFVTDYELLVKKKGKAPIPLKFSGGILKNQVWIIAASRDAVLEAMLKEMMLINNEQQNLIRKAEKKLSKKTVQDPEYLDSYDEISKVNNELINAQRKLVKQNEEILKLNRQLRSSNEELEHFAYAVSHDLKEPLRMVRSFMKLLEEKYGDQLDEKALKYVSFAMDGAERMSLLIDDLLEYSRVGRQGEILQKTDLNKVLESVKALHQSTIEATGASVVWDEMPAIICEEIHIQQVFNNLVSNSLKYNRENTTPKIEISFEEQPSSWKFSVKDNGIGIDPENYSVIFDLFRRADYKSDKSGSGIGLAICKKVVQQHQGEIWVESIKDEGSSFHFTVSKKLQS